MEKTGVLEEGEGEESKIYSIIIIYSFEFFTSTLADGPSLETEWQQVSIIIIIIIIIYSLRVFHISWLFIGDWVTASLLKSPGLFSVFWPFSIVL